MSFTVQTAGVIPVVLTYQIFDTETGEKVGENTCRFLLRRYTNSEAKADERDAALNEDQRAATRVVEMFARYLLEPPRGFADFPITRPEWDRLHPGEKPSKGQQFAPDDSPLDERARAYFSREETYLICDQAMAQWRQKMMPKELSFRP